MRMGPAAAGPVSHMSDKETPLPVVPPEPADDNDFQLGQACDLSDDGTCEACQ